jgi:catechol 2,3-dioxygenase-like lactoylglutathione lyase family enzyme
MAAIGGIRILDIAYPRLRVPDLDAAEEFLVNFGMIRSERTSGALYMRGTGPAHHIHVTEQGPAGFVSLAYYARSEGDLHLAARLPDAVSEVVAMDEPGGGKRVLLKEPNNGFMIEIVHGIAQLPELPVVYKTPSWDAETMRTVGDSSRYRFGPAHIRRISHGVLATPHVRATLDWFRDTLGLLCTDEFYIGKRENLVGGFYRLDRGAEPVDHHVLNVYKNERVGFQHTSFVVQDVEDLLIGHGHLVRLGKYHHVRGVGYHPPGGQIFDYWLNPWEQMHELYMPMQSFTSGNPSNLIPFPGAAAINRTEAFTDNITGSVPFDLDDY